MKIWMINHYAVSPNETGGTRHYHFAQELKQKGHEVSIITANFNHFSKHYHRDEHSDIPFYRIPVPSYKNNLSRFWSMMVFGMRLLRRKYLPKERPDIIMGSSPHLFAAFSGLLLAKRFKNKFVLEIRDLWPETLVALGKISNYHPIIMMLKWMEKILYRFADAILILLPGAEKYLQTYGVSPDKITWLPNGIHNTSYEWKVKQSGPIFRIVYAGSHGLANELETIIRAAVILEQKQLNPAVEIILIGDGPQKAYLKSLVGKNISIVKFLDPIPKKEIHSFMETADAFIMLLTDSPLFRWGVSPNKLYDYMLVGRPILFGVNTPFDPVTHAQAGLSFKPGNAESLAENIERLLAYNEQQLNEMGKNAHEYVKEFHAIPKLAEKLEGVIISL